jgi:hypothetical protein
MYFKWSFLLLLIAVVGCEPGQNKISTSFEGEFKKKKLDLRWALSEYFSVSDGTDSSAVVSYDISYNRKLRVNTVTEATSGDTVFHGFAMKYKGHWFLQQAISDSTFTLNAIKVKNGTIQGWGETRSQMRKVDSLARSGNWAKLVNSQSEDGIILDAKRKIITGSYQSWVASAQTKYLIDQGKIDFVAIDSYVTGIDGADIIRMIESVYPNPANDKFTLGMYEQRRVNVKIFDLRGRLLVDEIQETQDKDYDVSDWEPGVYVISLRDIQTQIPIDQTNLTIRR